MDARGTKAQRQPPLGDDLTTRDDQAGCNGESHCRVPFIGAGNRTDQHPCHTRPHRDQFADWHTCCPAICHAFDCTDCHIHCGTDSDTNCCSSRYLYKYAHRCVNRCADCDTDRDCTRIHIDCNAHHCVDDYLDPNTDRCAYSHGDRGTDVGWEHGRARQARRRVVR